MAEICYRSPASVDQRNGPAIEISNISAVVVEKVTKVKQEVHNCIAPAQSVVSKSFSVKLSPTDVNMSDEGGREENVVIFR